MPPPTLTLHPSRNAIILVALVERHHSFHIKHAQAPNHPPQHPAVQAAHAALTTASDFIFPSYIPPPQLPPRPIHPIQRLPVSSSAVYLALAEPASDTNPSSFRLSRPSPSSLRFTSRTFSNLSSSNTKLPNILTTPTSSPPRRLTSLCLPSYAAATDILQSDPSSSSPDPLLSDDESCCSALESTLRQFRATLLSATTHVFAITAQDGSRQYAFCRPLSSSHALVLVTSLSHTPVYVSALERTAATYACLVDDALSNPAPHTYPESIIRCPPHIANNLTEALLNWLNNCALPSSSTRIVSTHHTPSCPTSYSSLLTPRHPPTDLENSPPPCLTSSTASSALSAPGQLPDPTTLSENYQQHQIHSFWNTEPHISAGATSSSSDRITPTFPWDVVADAPYSSPLTVERVIELADATLLLRHFSVRNLISIVVALLEERRVCFVGPNTAVVSRAVLALDNLLRPFKWPHLISPILLARILPVLGAPFPYLVGILERHFSAAKELPLEDVVFADISSGKVTTVEGPGELYRHIPRRMRNRLERRLTRAKIACTRQILRSRSMLFSPAVSNTATSIVEVGDHAGFAKKEKPGLLKRSRSFVRVNEVSPQNIWLDHETTALVDKAMRKFFAELLDGCLDVHEIDNHNKLDLESKSDLFNQFLSQSTSSTGLSLGSSKRDSDKRQLALSFQRTQMFMQWRDEVGCDPSFGMGTLEPELQRGTVSRKRSKDREVTAQPKKATMDPDEDSVMKNPKFKIRLTSDMEDIFSGDDIPTGETGAMRKRFRSKRKHARRQGIRLQFNTDGTKNDVPTQSVVSNADESSSVQADLLSATETSVSNNITSTDGDADFENEGPSRRPWLSLRLPSSPWSTAREGAMLSGREGDTGSEACDQTDDGEETDPFDEPEESADITDMFPMENVGAGWTRMRQWSRRKNRHSARV